MNMLLDNVKIRLSITDDLQDDLLQLLIRDAESQLKLIISEISVPIELNFIIENVVVQKFNKRGSEGFKSESLGDHSITIESDDFKPYVSILDKYVDAELYTFKSGRVVYD